MINVGYYLREVFHERYVLLLCAAALSIGAACSSVSAHGVFIANRFDQKALSLGRDRQTMRTIRLA